MKIFSINRLISHPRNSEFFDDIIGEQWDKFLESVRTSGIIEPIIVTQHNVIVSGHQRVRACIEIGIPEIKVEIQQYDSEDQVLKDLIETNLIQRGIGNPNPVKFGRCIKELERIYGIRSGSANKKGTIVGEANNYPHDTSTPTTETEFAEVLGISLPSLKNYKKLAELIPEVEDFLDTGMISPTTALAITRQLSQDDQIALISRLDPDKKYAAKDIQELIDEIKYLKENPPTPSDYDATKQLNQKLEEEISELKTQLNNKEETQQQIADLKSTILSQQTEINNLTEEKQHKDLEIAAYRKHVQPVYQSAVEADEGFKVCEKLIDLQIAVLSPYENGDAINELVTNQILYRRLENTIESVIDQLRRILRKGSIVETIDQEIL